MSYSLPCECGAVISVTAQQAGSSAACRCGREVPVPSLSQLRKIAGQGAYESGILDTVNRMVREGELPQGETCVISGFPTDDFYNLYIQCEFVNKKRLLGWGNVIRLLLLMIWPLLFWVAGGFDEEAVEHGHDRGVYAPLRVRKEDHNRLKRIRSQAKLRRLLRTVPIYAELLKEYPRAVIRT